MTEVFTAVLLIYSFTFYQDSSEGSWKAEYTKPRLAGSITGIYYFHSLSQI